jgi:O-succinylbenzoic acid--CoA ligase
MFQLNFDQLIFQSKEDFEGINPELPHFAKAAVAFCKAWLYDENNFYQQTSGSTGSPKTIEIIRLQMLESAKATGVFFNTNSKTKLLCCLNPEYIAGKMMLVRAMVWDCPIWLVEPKSNPFLDLPEDFLPDFVAMVPLQIEACLRDSQALIKLKKVSNLIIGGAPISQKLKSQLIEKNLSAWQTYGMTETVSHIALAKIEDAELEYQTLPGVEIGQNERGAIWIKSPMSGPEKIQTNDLIGLTSQTSFNWLGRVDFAINSGGVKIHPELLEQKIENLVAEFFPESRYLLYGEKDEKLGERLVLIIETSKPNVELAKLLQSKLENELGKYQAPKSIYFLPSFVQTESGKINREKTYNQL